MAVTAQRIVNKGLSFGKGALDHGQVAFLNGTAGHQGIERTLELGQLRKKHDARCIDVKTLERLGDGGTHKIASSQVGKGGRTGSVPMDKQRGRFIQS